MKLRTAIVEDQKPDAERLEQLLKKAFGEEEILCRRFVCGDDFLKEFPGEGYQVCFWISAWKAQTASRRRAAARRRSGAAHRVCDILAGVCVGCLSGASVRLPAQTV